MTLKIDLNTGPNHHYCDLEIIVFQILQFSNFKPSLRYVIEGFILRHLDEFRAL